MDYLLLFSSEKSVSCITADASHLVAWLLRQGRSRKLTFKAARKWKSLVRMPNGRPINRAGGGGRPQIGSYLFYII